MTSPIENDAVAIFWLLCAYQAGHREGWEEGPSSAETLDGVFSYLCRKGFDPNESSTPRDLLGIYNTLVKRSVTDGSDDT